MQLHRFELDVLAADTAERTIEGVVMPYGEVATVQGRRFRFLDKSVSLARTRTPLLLDHDRARPVGVLVGFEPDGAGAFARFKVDETPAGDEALATAASGSRGAFSVGAELVEVDDRHDPIDVRAARIVEVSLLALGAFAGATVERVAAELDPPDDDPPDDDPPENPDQTELPVEPEKETEMEPVTATAPPVILRARADEPAREVGAGELVSLIVRAQHGEPDARRYLEAALAETISTDVSGLLPPTYEKTVLGGKEVARPLYETFKSRPLPGVGLQVNKPVWTTPPDGAWATDVNADATTNKVVVGSQSAVVARWDWAGAIPWVVVQRSDPSIVDEIYAEAVQDFYFDVEAKVYGELGAAPLGVATSLGAALAEFYTASGNKRGAEVIIMAPDVWGKFADATALSVAVAAGGVSSSDLSTSFAGIRAISSGTLPAGETILATRRAVDARVTEPVRLTANAIGALNVELAVVGEGLFDTDYPGELLRFAAIIPSLASTAGRSK
jgi:HK97 family phage prohead protease